MKLWRDIKLYQIVNENNFRPAMARQKLDKSETDINGVPGFEWKGVRNFYGRVIKWWNFC